MAKTSRNGHSNTQSHPPRRALSAEQTLAADCVATGMNDQETADKIGCARNTVNFWRLHNPTFIAAVNARRADLWQATSDTLRQLIPKALTVLAAALEHPDSQFKAALALVRMANIPLDTFDRRDVDTIEIEAIEDGKARDWKRLTADLGPGSYHPVEDIE